LTDEEPIAPAGVLLSVAYDGAAFAGFAPQPGQRTVHGVLLDAVHAIDPGVSKLRGASRTDAGVHARAQAVALDPTRAIPPKGWVLGVNAALPPDLAVRTARRVPRGYEPRANGRGKRYRYYLLVDRVRDPMLERVAWRIDPPFERARAEAELAAIVGTHDFTAFRSASDPRVDTIRTLDRVTIVEPRADEPRLLAIEVEGNAFMHNMVRIIAGTAVDVGRGRLKPGATARALASGGRTDLGMTAPPHGLILDEVRLELPPLSTNGDDAWP
jgi:tRNA pseudouridine38-40 synthase